ncbi:Thiamine pyrophosphate enzyme C-terminal TPP-binding [Penicillium hispanicum]|uniref:Thiamine pyrophosphate enzyme C-terminal TPP-binding n=1 Tax=Penicillium hispanicum TaxID=1080232 RepID=UPI0025416DCC|nr:Thiamine pyrophosphate enzyme C-terminal TPP-binding [Penicillium hispanicum]KAJ5578687.1 Thiamine pyrophosphate enzyme C-terminal TPP-binding [Penicillium hispanicum]
MYTQAPRVLRAESVIESKHLRRPVIAIGYPGGTIMPVFDALHDCPDFRFILPRHKQGAGHMAQGYARAARKPGVVLTTSGPGTTNLITTLQDALKDGTPLVVLVGQVSTHAIGTDAFQEADVIGITGPCTKWNTVVRDIRDLPARMNDAFRIAGSGRQGPVLVALPKDVTSAVLDTPAPLASSHRGLPQWDNPIQPSDILAIDRSARIKRCADLINRAQKPVTYAGNGVLSCAAGPQVLAQLAETACIPVATSLLRLGCFDEHNSKSLRMLGMHGTAYANKAIQEADLSSQQRPTRCIIHFEIHPPHINKVIACDEFVQGDVTAGLIEFLPHIRAVENRPEWMGQISHWKNTFPIKPTPPKHATRISPEFVILRLSELTEKLRERTIVTTGVGSHQMWAAQFFRWTGDRSLITSGGAGTMGFGLPAAIGAHVAQPDAIVIDIDGDASLSMSLHEMSTAAEFGAKVKILVLNNDEQGMVTSWQALDHDQRYTHAHQRNPGFVKVANGMGVAARRLDAASDITDKLEWFIRSEGPSLLDVKVDDKMPVLPWVTPGKALDEMIMSPSQIWTSKQ